MEMSSRQQELLSMYPELGMLDEPALTPIVRQVLGNREAVPLTCEVRRLSGGRGEITMGVYHVHGLASAAGQELSWSVVLKVLSLRGAREQSWFADPSHPLYWRREALAYESDLLTGLPNGVRPAQCYSAVEIDNDTILLWLEDLQALSAEPWSLENYAFAAYSLGRLNGTHRTQHTLSVYPWLVADGSPAGLLDYNQWARDMLAAPTTWESPLLLSAFHVPVADRLLHMWDKRQNLLSQFGNSQQTFCHLDAWRGNMCIGRDSSGDTGLVLFDWAFPGWAAAGTDPADLFAGGYGLSETHDLGLKALDDAIFDSYIQGLVAEGWSGDRERVRFVFVIFATLKYCALLPWLVDAPYPAKHKPWEELYGVSFDELVQQRSRLVYYLLGECDRVGVRLF